MENNEESKEKLVKSFEEKVTLTDKSSLEKKEKKYSESEYYELIKLCIELELFEEGYENMLRLIEKKYYILKEEEKNFLMRLAKEKLNVYRKGWKNLVDYEQTESDTQLKCLIEEQMVNLEKSIKDFCTEMGNLIDKFLEKVPENDKYSLIFYQKLKADYFRYYAEVASQEEFNHVVDKCQDLYEKTYEMSNKELQTSHALTLSVALNYSVFAYFIVDDTKKAYEIADKAYRNASKITQDNKSPEIDMLIKNIEDNLTIWKIELFDAN
jgi:hypothetical protein